MCTSQTPLNAHTQVSAHAPPPATHIFAKSLSTTSIKFSALLQFCWLTAEQYILLLTTWFFYKVFMHCTICLALKSHMHYMKIPCIHHTGF